MSSRTKQHGFILGFSYLPAPESLEGQPDEETLNKMIMPLVVIPPMLSFVFTTDNGEVPAVIDMFMAVREAYNKTADEPRLNEAYGIFLDALKKMHSSPFKFGEEEKALPPFPEDMPDGVKKIILNSTGHVSFMNGNVICLRLSKHDAYCITN